MNNTTKFKAGDLVQFKQKNLLLSVHLVCDFDKSRYSDSELIIITTVILGDFQFFTGDCERFYSTYLDSRLSNGSVIIL